MKRARAADSSADTSLAAREAAVLAREEAVDRRERAARTTDEHRAHTESHLREANERLVVASVQALANTEAAQHATAQMTIKAERDFLTGLPNRALLTDRLEQATEHATRHHMKVALMFLDLDRFKEVNDSLGHPVGDGLLQSVARRLQACLRHCDTVSRQGGDEFIVLLSEVRSVQDATLTAEKILRAMAAIHVIGHHQIRVTVSIGISVYPDDGMDVETVLVHADTAMFHAKRGGRNGYRQFTPDMTPP
jgi:diguanylate cyclase (GGDEF)-like protein